MDLKDLVLKSRTYRRFDETFEITTPILENLIELARLSPSAANRQPLKFIICDTKPLCQKVFPALAWAGYLKEWSGPAEGERPTAYIIILGDKTVSESFGVDHGIAAQSIMLGAAESGLGGCIIQSVKKDVIVEELNIPDNYEILLVLALGKPIEKVVLEEVSENNIKYWRDVNGTHHVPKRRLNDLILKI